jgi:hypothetical protein
MPEVRPGREVIPRDNLLQPKYLDSYVSFDRNEA